MWKRKWPDLERLSRGAPEPGKGEPGPFQLSEKGASCMFTLECRLIPSASSEPPKNLETLKTAALGADGCFHPQMKNHFYPQEVEKIQLTPSGPYGG